MGNGARTDRACPQRVRSRLRQGRSLRAALRSGAAGHDTDRGAAGDACAHGRRSRRSSSGGARRRANLTQAAAAAQTATAAHHDLAAPGSRPRERSVDGTDPTDMVAHLDDQDLEDLATLLFDRLQTRLRRDLIVDRERTGFLTDFR